MTATAADTAAPGTTAGTPVTGARPDGVPPLSVAVIGTGAIGQDLVSKICGSAVLECALVAGRDPESAGLLRAARLGCPTTAGGIDAILAAPRPFDVVFDATSARAHAEHWRLLRPLGTLLIDLTPSRTGRMVVPTVTGVQSPPEGNVSLISCGGQASVPLAHALAERFDVTYIEVVSTVASSIAGRATRLNLDEYVATTSQAVTAFTGVRDTKAILNISPAVPPATFRTTVHAVAPGAGTGEVRAVVDEAAEQVRGFAPGYRVLGCDVHDGVVAVSLEITADSSVLPPYAGNLDIIDAAAVLVAEQHAVRLASAARQEVDR
ncbi:acetaldehyde dehydrogenase (acetylating) [Streptomyces sp. CB01580]|uniref:acetaldehyde dehydrogenase (acetylating) n=1 Tax=Streptomyces sp. CB01580 TaxID=1703933 RepID=UPI00093D40D7|nr:acetaldehyde dehydrogenase (acetylating) [Streptomyces sp. CB01580]OKJ40043.1 acetaldehyde dehydrogenase [Streptomyces sp. CB01580]